MWSRIQHRGRRSLRLASSLAQCVAQREKATERRRRRRRGRRAGPVAFRSAAGTKGPSIRPGEFLIRGDKGRASQVINALSVSLPMFCRSGASQEESKAGGEYYDLQLFCVCACSLY